MSIVEKAVAKLPGRSDQTGSTQRDVRTVSPAPLVQRTGDGENSSASPTVQIAIKPAIALETYPALAKDFRFLKRPVLARVFGMARSSSDAGNIVMVTADIPQTGKSFVSVNLAASIAQEQMTDVLLIDADPVRHTLSSTLGCEHRTGLLELLADEQIRAADVTLQTEFPSLRFLPAGESRPDATELLASPRMGKLLRSFRDANLVVLLDSPPLALTSEARALVEHVHHVLVVVEAGRSTMTDVADMLQILQGSRASLGLVLNKAPLLDDSRYREYYPY